MGGNKKLMKQLKKQLKKYESYNDNDFNSFISIDEKKAEGLHEEDVSNSENSLYNTEESGDDTLKKDEIRKVKIRHLDSEIKKVKIRYLDRKSDNGNKSYDEKLKDKLKKKELRNRLDWNSFFEKQDKKSRKSASENGSNIQKSNSINNFESIKLNEKGSYGKPKINVNETAKHIRNAKKMKYYLGSLLYYKSPIYKRISDHECKTLIRKTLPEHIESQLTDFQLSEIVKLIKTDPKAELKVEDIKTEKWIIPFRNNLFNLKTNETLEASHKYYFFSCINADYDHENTEIGYTFENYLDTCTGYDTDLRNLILEVIGYILSNSMSAKKMFILYGVPDSGKSTFGEFIQNLIGIENCCHIPLQDLSKRFMVAELYGKKLCLNMDISDSPIRDTSIIKQLTGNDILSAERKGEHPFSFKNNCKLLYGCNNLPRVSNGINEQAFYRRLVIIPFLNSVSPDKQDKNLLKKLLKEKDYIIHEALKAFKRLVDNNYQFTTSTISTKILNEHILQSNNVLEFIENKCHIDRDACVYSSTLYNNYKKFCCECGYPEESILNLNVFSRAISSMHGIKNHRWREDGNNLRGFKGIKVKEFD